MTDIHPIKNTLSHFLSYLKPETWYFIMGAIGLYILYLIYLFIWGRYQKSLIQTQSMPVSGESYIQKLGQINSDDERFYEKMSFLLRSLMEDSGRISGATKKTPNEIHQKLPSAQLKKILDICTHYEYTKKSGDSRQDRETLRESIKNIIIQLDQARI